MPRKRRTEKPRRPNDDEIPPRVAEFFARGGRSLLVPWELLLPDDENLVRKWWRKFSAEHPDIPPPDNVPWLKLTAADPNSDAQTRDDQTAQSADEKTDAGIDDILTAERGVENDGKT